MFGTCMPSAYQLAQRQYGRDMTVTAPIATGPRQEEESSRDQGDSAGNQVRGKMVSEK